MTSSKISDGVVVRSLNDATDNVSLNEGDNIDISTSGNTITIAAPQVGLSAVQTDSPILGDGTSGSPVRLQSSGITAELIGNNAVTTNKIQTNAVTNSKLSSNAVREPNVEDGAITTPKIADGAVDTDQLATEAVTTSKIGAGQVTTNKLAGDAAVLSLNTLTGGLTLQGGTGVDVTPSGGNTLTVDVDFPEGGIDRSPNGRHDDRGDGVDTDLAVGTISSGQIATNAITSIELDNGAVASANLQNNAVGNTALAPGAVATENVQDNAITAAKIGSGQVTGSELANGAVDTPQLADDAVTSAKIGVGEVTATALADDAAVLTLRYSGQDELTRYYAGRHQRCDADAGQHGSHDHHRRRCAGGGLTSVRPMRRLTGMAMPPPSVCGWTLWRPLILKMEPSPERRRRRTFSQPERTSRLRALTETLRSQRPMW